MNEDYFVPSKVPQVYQSNEHHEYSVYSISNDSHSHEVVKELHKEYSGMDLDQLKFIYIRFHDLNLCRTFLDRFYPDKKKTNTLEKVEEKKKPVIPRKLSTKIEIKKGQTED
jgi:hypothetical protein